MRNSRTRLIKFHHQIFTSRVARGRMSDNCAGSELSIGYIVPMNVHLHEDESARPRLIPRLMNTVLLGHRVPSTAPINPLENGAITVFLITL